VQVKTNGSAESPSPALRERVASLQGEPGEGLQRNYDCCALTRLRASRSDTLSRNAGEGLRARRRP